MSNGRRPGGGPEWYRDPLPFSEPDPVANWVVMREGETAQLLAVGAPRFGTLGAYARAACGYPIAPEVCRLATAADRRCGRCRRSRLARQARP